MKQAAILIALALAAPCCAQTWQVFDTTTAGFPSNSVTGIAFDSQGGTWVATDWGLCHYDGSIWETFQTTNSGLTDNVIQSLAVDTLDRVWIGTLLHGVVIYDGSTWTTYDQLNSGLPDDQIKSITIDHRNWACIGTYLGLACFTGTEWRLYNDTPSSYSGLQLNGPVINDVDVRADGLVMVGTLNGGFHYLTDTSVVVHATFIDLFPDNTQVGVAFDTVHDERWIACPAQGLLRQGGSWENGPWFQYSTTTSTIPTNSLTCLAMDPSGRPWMGTTYAGVMVRNNDGTFSNYTSTNSGLPDNTISRVDFAPDGSLWVGTYYGGAARFGSGSVVNETTAGNALTAYPVPAGEVVNVKWQGTHAAGIWRATDLAGRFFDQGELPSGSLVTIAVEDWPPGTYFIGFTAGSVHQAIRIQVQ